MNHSERGSTFNLPLIKNTWQWLMLSFLNKESRMHYTDLANTVRGFKCISRIRFNVSPQAALSPGSPWLQQWHSQMWQDMRAAESPSCFVWEQQNKTTQECNRFWWYDHSQSSTIYHLFRSIFVCFAVKCIKIINSTMFPFPALLPLVYTHEQHRQWTRLRERQRR